MNILDDIKKNFINKPFLNHKRAVLSAPVRHIFMIATIGFLKNQNINNLNILEIGSWFGASTLSWAQGLEKYYGANGSIDCVDAWQPFFEIDNHKDQVYVEEMEQLLRDDVVFKIFLHNIETITSKININYYRTISDTFFNENKEKKYNVIFIDADHSYDAVIKDIKNSLDLIEENGIICGDDLNLQMHQVNADNAKVNRNKDFIRDPLSSKNFHPGVTIAVDEVFGKVHSWGGYWAVQKKKDSWENISLKNVPVLYPEHFHKDLLDRAMDHYNDIKENIL